MQVNKDIVRSSWQHEEKFQTRKLRNRYDGRGGKACALMIKAETGMPTPLKELEQQCNQMIDAWKTVTFPTAWHYLEGCQQAVYDPGYVENPWGFRKTFHVRSGTVRKDFEREAGNFPKHWSGEVKQGEFRGSLHLIDNSSLLRYNEQSSKVILIQALQECSEGATTRAESRTDGNGSTSALLGKPR